jgi:hypothetical protein
VWRLLVFWRVNSGLRLPRLDAAQQLLQLRAQRLQFEALLVDHIAQLRVGLLQVRDADFNLLDGRAQGSSTGRPLLESIRACLTAGYSLRSIAMALNFEPSKKLLGARPVRIAFT